MLKMVSSSSSLYLLLLLASLAKAHSATCTTSEQWESHPLLCHSLERIMIGDTESMAEEIMETARNSGWMIDFRSHQPVVEQTSRRELRKTTIDSLPVVLAHGMGDSCFNPGIKHILSTIGKEWLNDVYTVCIPTGKTQAEDTNNGFFLNMDASVEIFKETVFNNTKLQKGFHAVGFSQGNNVIRGYITKYNTPAVHSFLSVNGVNAGTSRVPNCFSNSAWCHFLAERASDSAYTEFSQEHSFQANYWRDTVHHHDDYLKYSQLAVWNNEGETKNEAFKENWARTQKFAWVLATDDSMIWPLEGEHWGEAVSDEKVIPMKETEWYKEDFFGLKTADDAGKNEFISFEGDHLQFALEDLHKWVLAYFTEE